MSSEESVTIPPEVVRIRASSTVFVKASMRVKRDLSGIVPWSGVVEDPLVLLYQSDPAKRSSKPKGYVALSTILQPSRCAASLEHARQRRVKE